MRRIPSLSTVPSASAAVHGDVGGPRVPLPWQPSWQGGTLKLRAGQTVGGTGDSLECVCSITRNVVRWVCAAARMEMIRVVVLLKVQCFGTTNEVIFYSNYSLY